MRSVRVMTWNIQGGLATSGDFAVGKQAAFLKAQAPDIVMLQEVQDALSNKAQGVEQTETLAQAAGLPHHEFWMLEDFRGMRSGVALLSRWPLTDIERTPVPRPWFNSFWPNYQGPRGILSANVVIDGQTWRIRSTHVTFHVDSPHMANHLRLLAEQSAQTPADVWTVLGGDFNTGQDDPLFAGLLETMTVVAGATIDLIWVGKPGVYRATDAGSPDCGEISDHNPTVVTLQRTSADPPPTRLDSVQPNWRWCNKCQGLFFGGDIPASGCPAGGSHAPDAMTSSGNYSLFHNVGPAPDRQSNWRWCSKCQGLFFGDWWTKSVCPTGGTHANPTTSGNYSLFHNVGPAPDRQSNWRWCNKCQGLFFGGDIPHSRCPAGGSHAPGAAVSSGNYSLLHVAQSTATEPAACVGLRTTIAELKSEIAALQADLQSAAPAERSAIARQIKTARGKLSTSQDRANGLGCTP